MPMDRVPQNSANFSHYKLLADLQAVYEKIIPSTGNSAVFPRKSRDHIRRLGVHLDSAATRINSHRDLKVNPEWIETPRAKSSASSIDEIMITPLPIHPRLATPPVSCRPVYQDRLPDSPQPEPISIPVATLNFPEYPDSPRRFGSRGTTPSPSLSNSSPMYSEQSLRYVHGQVAAENARRLRNARTQTHRLDRRYMVAGSRAPVSRRTAFEDSAEQMVASMNRSFPEPPQKHKDHQGVMPTPANSVHEDDSQATNSLATTSISVDIRPVSSQESSQHLVTGMTVNRKALRRHSASSTLPLKKMDFGDLRF